MIRNLSDKIAEFLFQQGKIKQEEKELCRYGLIQGTRMFLNFATALIIGVLMGMGWQSMVFMLTFIPIRSYAGGYHAQTPARCYLFSILIVIVSLLGLKYMKLDFWVFLLIMAISSGTIFSVAPLESSNKPLSGTELCIYRRRTRLGLVIVLVFMTTLYPFKPEISGSMLYAIAVLAILLIMGKLND